MSLYDLSASQVTSMVSNALLLHPTPTTDALRDDYVDLSSSSVVLFPNTFHIYGAQWDRDVDSSGYPRNFTMTQHGLVDNLGTNHATFTFRYVPMSTTWGGGSRGQRTNAVCMLGGGSPVTICVLGLLDRPRSLSFVLSLFLTPFVLTEDRRRAALRLSREGNFSSIWPFDQMFDARRWYQPDGSQSYKWAISVRYIKSQVVDKHFVTWQPPRLRSASVLQCSVRRLTAHQFPMRS
ncbi:hypothetical protein BV25DRAFT_1840042 [Artomyces pyxidatus]|uniref:Uncharacterized protein n=1 Tax=Artomyces pyxidatus TaxID=48021 RepID=A0ACB8SUK8_9AGAM|nr:hypothetical protein BV25DRAFT_1840042 [Artomyces pyxidatus]